MSAAAMSGLPLQVGSPNGQLPSLAGVAPPASSGAGMLQRGLGAEPATSDVDARVFIENNLLNRAEGAQSNGALSPPTERPHLGFAEREPQHPVRSEPPPHPNEQRTPDAPGAGRDVVQNAPQRQNALPSGQRPAQSQRTTDAAMNSARGHEDLSAVVGGGHKVNSRGVEAGVGLSMAEGDFWGRVVTTQNALQGHPHCPPGQALGLAIAWAVAASGLDPAPTTRGSMPKVPGASASTSGSVAPRSSSTQATSEADLEEWVGRLHTDLSAKASRALIAAWEQRGSALRAVTYDRG